MSKRLLTFLAAVVAVMLSIGSLAYACTTMKGQTYIDTSFGNREPNPGDSFTAHANGLKQLPTTEPQYYLMQDGQGTYCHPGASIISPGLGRGTTDPWNTGSITGTLDTNLGSGTFFICVGNYEYSAWPVELEVY